MWPILIYGQEDENYIICDFASRAAAVLGDRDVVSYGRVDAALVYYMGRNAPVVNDVNEVYEQYLGGKGVVASKENFEQLKGDERFKYCISSLDRDRGLFVKDKHPLSSQTGKSLPAPTDKAKTDTATKKPPVSKAIEEIIANRYSWNPILTDFYGKEMPDFKFEDITGKTHNLSDYRGKNVLVVMWATWCLPCQEEIPHLIALREIMPADKLAILAISNESARVIKATAQSRKINYTVISYRGTLPEPFSNIRGYPSTFFIRPDGVLKLVIEGGTYLGEMKAIILAE
jgi:peroxiredoxin